MYDINVVEWVYFILDFLLYIVVVFDMKLIRCKFG